MLTHNRYLTTITEKTRKILKTQGKCIFLGFLAIFMISLLSSSLKTIIPPNISSIATSFHTGIERVSLGPTIFMVTYASISPLIGTIVDILSARNVMLLGLAIGGISLILAATIPNIIGFLVFYGICGGFAYNCISYVPIGVFVDETIHTRKGLAFGLLANGSSIGFIILAPLWISLSTGTIWNKVFIYLGIIFIGLLFLALLLLPQQAKRKISTEEYETSIPEKSIENYPSPWASKSLLLLALTFSICGLSMGFIDVHIVASLQQTGIGQDSISMTVAVLGIVELICGMTVGTFVDKGLAKIMIAGSYWLRAISLIILAFSHNISHAIIFGIMFGASYMGTVIVTTQYIMKNYNPNHRGLALGLIWLAHNLGAALSSQLGAWSIEKLHSYHPIILGIALLCCISGIICFILFPQSKSSHLDN